MRFAGLPRAVFHSRLPRFGVTAEGDVHSNGKLQFRGITRLKLGGRQPGEAVDEADSLVSADTSELVQFELDKRTSRVADVGVLILEWRIDRIIQL